VQADEDEEAKPKPAAQANSDIIELGQIDA
jgi:hypothetical protein